VGIRKYLAEQLGLQVHRVQTINHFRVSRDANLKLLQDELPSFATAFAKASSDKARLRRTKGARAQRQEWENG